MMDSHDIQCRKASALPPADELLATRHSSNSSSLMARTHLSVRGHGSGASGTSSSQRQYEGTSFDIEMARGECISTRSTRAREHRVSMASDISSHKRMFLITESMFASLTVLHLNLYFRLGAGRSNNLAKID